MAPKGTDAVRIAIVGSSDRSMSVDGVRDHSEHLATDLGRGGIPVNVVDLRVGVGSGVRASIAGGRLPAETGESAIHAPRLVEARPPLGALAIAAAGPAVEQTFWLS